MTSTRVTAALLAALALPACTEAPQTDPTAQQSMIGLSGREVLACMGGRPSQVTRPAEGTEIWSWPLGVTTTDSPPWSVGTNFSLIARDAPCEVRLVMTNGRVSQVAYRLPDGRALPSGRQCSFPVWTCAAAGALR
ncbi:hypothetical protein DFR50_14929 [Roseiarcus fermentans]|uniref:Uncharacterized protein n=1 Tax=Roseiarcus fermentans TaxID=1473586 RepID=A0A366EM81_9HYPH|nr:hypothetical protein [Roseiarcus fermentans]RBP02830.1 hypothetical protein DFR50_14929 [Roseiarcus fermentans]